MKHTFPVVATVIISRQSSSMTNHPVVGWSARAPLGRRGGGTNQAAIAVPLPDCTLATTRPLQTLPEG